ncbi:MAG: restriction endonuclease subunit S [Moraxella sp.]|nr:restriction endonuclease subunit S [Moraxella sp.]
MKDTILLGEIANLQGGTPQFRTHESTEPSAPVYYYYTQSELDIDFWQSDVPNAAPKPIRTMDNITQLNTGDVVFSLISGKAAQVQAIHQGYLYTQNYLKITPKFELNATYLLYLLNENADIARQFSLGLQGSQVLKYTVKQLKELRLPTLPSLDIQALIGNIYLQSQRLITLKKQIADNQHRLILAKLAQGTTL